jgi:hypothetical protein
MSGPLLSAELVEDSGAACASPDFFRSALFLRAEAVTHSLVIDHGRVILPLIRREIPDGGGYDAISPYGYPGGLLHGEAPHVSDVDFASTGLVSLFLRERLGASVLGGGIVRAPVLVHDPSSARAVHRRVVTTARSNERSGYHLETLPGPAVDAELLEEFADAYAQTMRRAGAADRYFFSTDYLRACLDFRGSWLVVVRGPDEDLASAAIAAQSDRHVHYFLGATADAHRSASPAKNAMIGLLDLSDRLAVPLNLGGGMSPGDGLHAFKERFANAQDFAVTHGVVCDADTYAALADGLETTDFFPAYRAPRLSRH